MLSLVLGIFKEGDCGQVREVKLMAQLVLLVGLVDGQSIRSQDEEDGFPGLLESN